MDAQIKTQPTLVLVEHNQELSNILLEWFRDEGFRTVAAYRTAEEATAGLRAMQQRNQLPDVLLCDHHIRPDSNPCTGDGLSLMREFKDTPMDLVLMPTIDPVTVQLKVLSPRARQWRKGGDFNQLIDLLKSGPQVQARLGTAQGKESLGEATERLLNEPSYDGSEMSGP